MRSCKRTTSTLPAGAGPVARRDRDPEAARRCYGRWSWRTTVFACGGVDIVGNAAEGARTATKFVRNCWRGGPGRGQQYLIPRSKARADPARPAARDDPKKTERGPHGAPAPAGGGRRLNAGPRTAWTFRRLITDSADDFPTAAAEQEGKRRRETKDGPEKARKAHPYATSPHSIHTFSPYPHPLPFPFFLPAPPPTSFHTPPPPPRIFPPP